MSTVEPENNDQASQANATPADSSESQTTSSPVSPPASAASESASESDSAGAEQPNQQPADGFAATPSAATYPNAGYGPAFVAAPVQPPAPWIHPARRVAVAVIAVIAAVVLVGLGFLGGSLVTGHGNHHRTPAFAHSGYGQFRAPQGHGPNGRTSANHPSGSGKRAPSPTSTS